jgi:hypothetical protein
MVDTGWCRGEGGTSCATGVALLRWLTEKAPPGLLQAGLMVRSGSEIELPPELADEQGVVPACGLAEQDVPLLLGGERGPVLLLLEQGEELKAHGLQLGVDGAAKEAAVARCADASARQEAELGVDVEEEGFVHQESRLLAGERGREPKQAVHCCGGSRKKPHLG